MRCALSVDRSKTLREQQVEAWGEMQSTREDPAYKEADIKGVEDREYFNGYKSAMDDALGLLEVMKTDDEISGGSVEEFRMMMESNICMNLFSILDHQEE